MISKILYRLKLILPDSLKSKLIAFAPISLRQRLKKGEVHVISFPKCGRSWLKLLFCDMVYMQHPEVVRFNDVSTEQLYKVNSSVPRIIFSHDDEPQFKRPSEIEKDKRLYANATVIFLVRDPRDVLVSWYYEYKNRVADFYKKEKGLLDDTEVSKFINNESGGLDSIIQFYNNWYDMRDVPKNFLIVKYEDLRSSPLETLKKINSLIGLDQVVEEAILRQAIDKNDFKRVQQREREGKIAVGNIKNEFGSSNSSDTSHLKARKGKVGGYVESFTTNEITMIDQRIKEKLNPAYNY